MGWGFRKSIKIAPGVRLNLSKRGVSGTFGGKGASINVGSKGAYLNTGIPGTGLYSRTKIGGATTEGSTNVIAGSDQPSRSTGLGFKFLCIIGYFSGYLAGNGYVSFFILSGLLLLRGLYYFGTKEKPVYGREPVYKADRRYKTGRRLEGYKEVVVGHEPFNELDFKLNKRKGIIRLIWSGLFLILGVWFFMEV